MISAGFAFVVAVIVAAVLTPIVRRTAERRGLVEGTESPLKRHERAVPRVGGIALVAAFFVPLGLLMAYGTQTAGQLQADPLRLAAFCAGGLVIFGLGLWDDLRGLAAPAKLVVEVGVALGLYAAGIRVDAIQLSGSEPTHLGLFGLVATIVWVVGVTNALNLVDGLDGLAAGVTAFAAGAHVMFGYLDGNWVLAALCAALAGAALGFLPQNFYPARIFLGDSGALFAGYVLAVASVYGATQKTTTIVTLLAPVLVLGLPILDTLLAMHRRALRRRPIFDGDREHVHHRLLDLGLSQRRSVWLLYALCSAFALAGVAITARNDLFKAIVLASLVAVLAVFERRLGFLRQIREARQPVALVPALKQLRTAAREARDLDTLWAALEHAAEDLGFLRLALSAGERTWSWTRPGLAGPPREGLAKVVLRLPPAGPRGAAEVRGEKRPLRRGAPELDEILAALLAEYLGAEPAPD